MIFDVASTFAHFDVFERIAPGSGEFGHVDTVGSAAVALGAHKRGLAAELYYATATGIFDGTDQLAVACIAEIFMKYI
jgi:hypothetical protein